MFDPLRTRVLRLMRVPHDPDPPAGALGAVRVFRAGRNFYKLRLARWGLAQVGALVGIWISLLFFEKLEAGVETTRREVQRAAVQPPGETPQRPPALAPSGEPGNDAPPKASPAKSKRTIEQQLARTKIARLAEKWPLWVFPLLKLIEWAGILVYVAQIPITYAMARLDYELRWYIVTDRSLRIRAGLTTVLESTMSFANVQQVVVTQGPLQRLLGLADVRVQSAGGGGESEEVKAADSLHTGIFHGVDNAHEIRDLILERLRRFRETGLGDPDEIPRLPAAVETATRTEAIAAAQELLAEAQALRRTVASA